MIRIRGLGPSQKQWTSCFGLKGLLLKILAQMQAGIISPKYGMLRLSFAGEQSRPDGPLGKLQGLMDALNGLKSGQFHGLSVMYRATASARERTCIFS